MLTKEQYDEHFNGWEIINVTVHHRACFYFVLAGQTGTDARIRIVRLSLKGEELKFSRVHLSGYDRYRIQCDIVFPDKVMAIDADGAYFLGDSKVHSRIPYIAEGGPLGGTVKRLKTIDGFPAMICSTARDLLMRNHEDETWTRIGPQPDPDIASYEGFDDFHAFALDDIYATSSAGLFHFDGTKWECVLNKHTTTVCCAPDGYVYATTWTVGGLTVYRGRDSKWTEIYKTTRDERHSAEIKDTVWHDGRIWVSSWSNMTVFEKGKYVKKFDPTAPSGGFLSARDGVLLCASSRSAYWHGEGGDWNLLFKGWELE